MDAAGTLFRIPAASVPVRSRAVREDSKLRIRIATWWLLAAALLAGCAATPQTPIAMGSDYFNSAKAGRIGVVVAELPAPDTSFPGADCLLCLAAASVANSSMTSAVKGWPLDDIKPLRGELVSLLNARGLQAQAVEEPLKIDALPDRNGAEPGSSRKDFSSFKARGVDRLLVVNVKALGAWRNYAAYVPTGAPRAVFRGEAYIVDLGTHRFDWYLPIELSRPADGNWDEPPKFPGLTNAYFQVLEEGKDLVKRPFQR